ncbi:CoA-binding protein [filamentous cyanobacterium LEGE 11480]|uniref:CoA-binding protein n=1 Tax=Romeriopsis navalis LEGE 11480 TaxID=2777977 RepID=A0A928VVX6_9CYAN|nr:CoA-binding protein [Romeriopsis navalis]MBE9033472.1 CoA-binding protein [Romeriopsis navalis LEGE 11480]
MSAPSDETIRQILTSAKTIAIVGHSAKPKRISYQIAQVLKQNGYQIYPVNPGQREIDGQPCYASLSDIPVAIDIVNVFRRPEYIPDILRAAINIQATTFWAQLGISHPEAEHIAATADINLIMDRCIKIEYQRLM